MRLIVCCNSLLTSLPLSLISKLPRVQNCSLSSLCIPECTYHTNARSAPLAPILYKIVCLIFAPIVFFIKHWRLFKNLHFRSDYCYYYPTCKLSFKWEGEVVENKKNILDKRRQIMDTRKTVTYWHFNKCVFVRWGGGGCGQKFTGLSPFRSGGRIFFSRVNFCADFNGGICSSLCYHSCKSQPFCQKCRWQVTLKHACIIGMWLRMKWDCKWVYGVHRMYPETAAVSCGTSCVTTKLCCQ